MTVPVVPQAMPSTAFAAPCLKPDFFPTVIDKIAEGSSALEVCKDFGIKYNDLLRYMYADPVRDKAFKEACKAGESWLIVRLTQEITAIGLVDIKDAFTPDGALKDIADIPEFLRRTIASSEVEEIWEKKRNGCQIGVVKKIKLNDKLKAIEMLGKKLKMFIDEVHVSGTVKVEHSVSDMDIEERVKMAIDRKNK